MKSLDVVEDLATGTRILKTNPNPWSLRYKSERFAAGHSNGGVRRLGRLWVRPFSRRHMTPRGSLTIEADLFRYARLLSQ